MKRLISLFVITLFSVVLVSADDVDDQGNPNDPAVNDRANACYEGGSMEGKCDTDWEWMCGWYIIRLVDSQDLEQRAVFPQECVSLLPALIREEVISEAPAAPGIPGALCFVVAEEPGWAISFYWPGGPGPDLFIEYEDIPPDYCNGTPIGSRLLVYGATSAEARAKCNELGYRDLLTVGPFPDYGLFGCYVSI